MSKKKIQVLIADDEYLICELLKNIIQWDDLNLQLIGFVHNGLDLLKEIDDKRPDIVITDICMPGIDGIEIIKQTLFRNIPCKFIIVSGYRQFEYAHNALKYNVEDYILKPVDSNELNGTLQKLVTQMQAIALPNQEALIHYSANDNIKKFFLSHGIWEIRNQNISLEQITHDYSILFHDGFYQILHIKLDVTNKAIETVDDLSSLNKKLLNSFNSFFEEYCYQILIYSENNSIFIGLNYDSSHLETINNCLQKYHDYTRNLLDMFIGLKITIGVGNAYTNVTLFSNSHQEAQNAIYYRMIEGIDRIIYWDKLHIISSSLSKQKQTETKARLRRSFEILDINDFKLCMKELFFIPKRSFPCLEMIEFINQITELFIEVASSLTKKLNFEDSIRKQIQYSIHNATTIKELENALTETIVSVMDKMAKDVEEQNIKPIRIALQYIEDHYSQQIKLEDIANQVLLNPVYFSNIFKKETGETFIDYLSKYRMDIAKELLRQGDLNITEISEAVGYNDARYFSKLFKKIIGIKPTEYKKIYN